MTTIRHQPRIDFDAVNRAALHQVGILLKSFLPSGKVDGDEYVALNPRRNDRHLGSFRINMTTGQWADFALDDVRGGDLVSLVAYLHDENQVEAARRLGHMVGAHHGR